MKTYRLILIALSCLLSFATAAQDSQTLATRVMRNDTGMVLFKRKEAGKFIVASVIEKRSRMFYMMDRCGGAWDSLRMDPSDCMLLLSRQADPFTYYTAALHQRMAYYRDIISQLRRSGSLDTQSPYYSTALWEHPEFTHIDSASKIRSIIAMEKEFRRDSVFCWGKDAADPRQFTSSTTYARGDTRRPGEKFVRRDTLLLINPETLSKVHMAMVIRKEARISYFSRDNLLLASFNLEPGEMKAVTENTDVFAKYLELLEAGKIILDQQVAAAGKNGRVIQYALLNQDDKALADARKRQRSIDTKLEYAVSPDLEALAGTLKEAYAGMSDNRAWLTYLGIIGYSTPASWDSVGNKRYELTDLRGNVMATISDARTAVSGYYLPDVKTAQDYFAFGALMPGRSINTANTRYGFNGKENDNAVKGVGNQQDYGARIYDPRVGRFLSVDRISSSYPMLTPYQFASNRPIDGIDIDGKEYGTVHVNTYEYKSDKATTYRYTSYDPTQSNVSGPQGPGVMYDITVHYKNANGSTGSYTYGHFVERNAKALFGIFKTDYGNFYGATSVLKVDKYGSFEKDIRNPNNNLRIPAVDAIDQGGKTHDYGYDKLVAIGKDALFNDWGTTPVDQQALSTWTKFLRSHKVGDQDPVGTAKVTQLEVDAASNGIKLFSIIVHNKKAAIAQFIYENFKNTIIPALPGGTDYDYNLFIRTYLQKDKDGNYVRTSSMWRQDSNGNWTPITPKK